ncbi:MAG: hypothetical protein ACHQNA_05985 [Acidimicrobiales bacterium]
MRVAVSIGLWWSTAWLMLKGQIRWRALLVSGVVTGLGVTLYATSASLWMPHTVASDQRQFGLSGVALALVSRFTGAGSVIVVGARAGAVLAEEEGWPGRLARGHDASVLAPGAAPLPPLTRPLALVHAFGIHTGDDDHEREPDDD